MPFFRSSAPTCRPDEFRPSQLEALLAEPLLQGLLNGLLQGLQVGFLLFHAHQEFPILPTPEVLHDHLAEIEFLQGIAQIGGLDLLVKLELKQNASREINPVVGPTLEPQGKERNQKEKPGETQGRPTVFQEVNVDARLDELH